MAKKASSTKGKAEAKAKSAEGGAAAPVTPRLMKKYFDEVLPALATQFGRKNKLSLPRLEKIVVNMGVGEAVQDKKFLETAVDAMGQITGQKPVMTKARQAISNFKLREGMPIGCMVTLRGRRMYEFLDRLISLALPRVRDFRGINRKAFDGNGNYSLGLSEQLVFPELNPDKFTRPQGMTIAFVVRNATDDGHAVSAGPSEVDQGQGGGRLSTADSNDSSSSFWDGGPTAVSRRKNEQEFPWRANPKLPRRNSLRSFPPSLCVAASCAGGRGQCIASSACAAFASASWRIEA
jgi:large subunit ribosomal protein L5